MTPDPITELLRAIPDPALRELVCRQTITVARQVRAETLRELHRKLGSWQKVGDAVGLARQDVWRAARR